MAVSQTELEDFAQILYQKIKDEFANQYMSKNLVDTIVITETVDKITIEIPAETYNMLLFQTKGVVVPYHNGKSYAMKLNETGSEFKVYPNGTVRGSYWVHPGNHIGYLERVIDNAIAEWQAQHSTKYSVDNVTKY